MNLQGKSNLIFIKGAKTGGSSIVRALRIAGRTNGVQFKKWSEVNEDTKNTIIAIPPDKVFSFKNQQKIFWENSYKFSVCRNPINKTISGFNYHPLCDKKDLTLKEAFNLVSKCSDIYKTNWKVNKPRTVWQNYSLYNHLFATQKEYLYEDDKPLFDEILSFENLSEQIKEFSLKIDLHLELPHINKNRRSDKRELTKEDYLFIMDRFRQDFELFNYPKIHPYMKDLSFLKHVTHKDQNKSTTTLKFKKDLCQMILKEKPQGDFLEIGTHEGNTTYVLANLAKVLGVKLYSFDNCEDRIKIAKEKCSSLGNCNIINKDVYNEDWNVKNIGFVFIDAKHQEKCVQSDLDNAFKILNKKGIVVVHDYGLVHPEGDCTKNLIKNSKKFRVNKFLGEKEGWNKLGIGRAIDWEGAEICQI